jgi:hypothetical protein
MIESKIENNIKGIEAKSGNNLKATAYIHSLWSLAQTANKHPAITIVISAIKWIVDDER